jgi:hypothetical protein
MDPVVLLREKDQIVVGESLPFSIYTMDKKLLLAAGRVVENERTLEMLCANGHFRSVLDSDTAAPKESTKDTANTSDTLQSLRKDYDTSDAGHRLSIMLAQNETEEACPAQLLGTHENCVIVTAPVRRDGSVMSVTPGQTLLCRAFQVTSAFRFRATVLNVYSDPYPHLHLEIQKDIERRKVRGWSRANVFVHAELHNPDVVPCVIADLSAGGARVAVDSRKTLERGQNADLILTLPVLHLNFDLKLNASVANPYGPSDARYPQISFYGLKFNAPGEREFLILQAFASSHLCVEFDSLGHLLSMGKEASGAAS